MDVRLTDRGDGTWEASLPPRCAAVRGAAKVRPRRIVHGATYEEAMAEAEAVLAHDFPAWRVGSSLDTAELCLNYLQRSPRNGWIAEDTAHDYELMIRRYVEPNIAADADCVTAVMIEDLYALLLDCGGAHGNSISARTIQKLNTVLNKSFNWMCREGIIAGNPIAAVELPRVVKRPMRVLSERESAALLDALAYRIAGPLPDDVAPIERVYAMGAWTGWWTGTRVGEVCGLLRRGVSFSDGRLTFDGSVSERRHLHRKDPKRPTHRRTIAPGSEYMDSLRSYFDWLREDWLEPHIVLTESMPVFCRSDGSFIRPSDMSDSFKAMALESGIELERGESFHSLRHTNGTLLLAGGRNPKEVQRRFGHSRAATTLDNYGHAMPGEDAAAADDMEGIAQRIREAGRL